MTHGEPFLLRSYCRQRRTSSSHSSRDIVAGKEVIVPCMVDGNKEDLHMQRAKIQRLQGQPEAARLQPEARLRRLGRRGLPPASAACPASPTSPVSAASIPRRRRSPSSTSTATASPTCASSGPAASLLLQNGGERFSEVSLPGVTSCRAGGVGRLQRRRHARPAAGHADGPQAVHQPRQGTFRDDSHLLPQEPGYNLTAAAWIDYDGDGKPDILLGNGFHGLRLYRNNAAERPGRETGPAQARRVALHRPVRQCERAGLRRPLSAREGNRPDQGSTRAKQGESRSGRRATSPTGRSTTSFR